MAIIIHIAHKMVISTGKNTVIIQKEEMPTWKLLSAPLAFKYHTLPPPPCLDR